MCVHGVSASDMCRATIAVVARRYTTDCLASIPGAGLNAGASMQACVPFPGFKEIAMCADQVDHSRRQWLQAGVGVGLAAALPAALAQAADALPLITKPIPSTGERLPVIGIGTAWFGNASYADLRAILGRMQALGGTLIDTAAVYGTSEASIGQALEELGLRSRMFVATKFDSGARPGGGPGTSPPVSGPPPAPPAPAGAGMPPMVFDGVGGEASFRRSLARLRTDRVDLLQVHGLNGTEQLMPLLVEWKRAGKVRYLGVTSSDPRQHEELMAMMRRHPLDFIQVNYSLGDRAAAAAVLPLAEERGMAVLVNLPLGGAALFEKLRGRELPGWAAEIDARSWGQILLKYVVSHPAVTCAIPGSIRMAHLEDNQGAGRGRLPDARLRRRIEQYWDSLA